MIRLSGRTLAAVVGAYLLTASVSADVPRELSFRTLGFYGLQLDLGDFAYLKFSYTEPSHKENITRYNAALEEAHDAGKLSLVGLYTFDRVSHKQPIDTYLTNTDTLLEGLRRDLIHAVCLGEENVTWNKGSEILNALYDRVTGKWKLECYQWLSMPYPPQGQVKADGWVLDAYGYDYDTFRRHLAKFVITGKPVVVCVNATAPGAKHAAEQILPGQPGSAAEAQMRICREFNVPVFFYAVDRNFGNVHGWLRDSDQETVRCRRWAMDWISRAHEERPGGLPLVSADYLEARPAEVCGGIDHAFAQQYDFSATDFLNSAGVEGLSKIRWDGMTGKLLLEGNQRPEVARLFWHLTSPLEMDALTAAVTGRAEGKGARVTGAVAPDVLHWSPSRREVPREAEDVQLESSLAANWRGREAWVMLEMFAPPGSRVAIDTLSFRGRTRPPADRTIRLAPGPERAVLYHDDFSSPKLIHFAEVEPREELQWQAGNWFITGKQGGANSVRLRIHFTSDKPLAEAEVKVGALAWTRDHNASIRLGLSANGQTLLTSRNTTDLPQDERYHRFSGEVSLPLDEAEELRGTRDFWLVIEMVNSSGVKAGPSNLLNSLQVLGRAGPS